MALNFGDWVVTVAINGVKSGSFGREWAALQLADYYAREKITEADLSRFDEEMTAYEEEIKAQLALEEEIMEMEGEMYG